MSATPDPSTLTGFAALGLSAPLLSTLTELGYEEPTPVQKAALPALLAGKDVLGQAATGTGKTAAFALPILQRLEPGACAPFEAGALVLVPTRELAVQVSEAIARYGRGLGVSVVPIYGGAEMGPQLRALKRGVDVVVATPGRALDHVRKKSLKLGKVKVVVLDEADEMLDLGFADDLDLLLGELPATRQTALFSATLPRRIATIAEKHLRDPVRVTMAPHTANKESLPKIAQRAYVVPGDYRALALSRLLDVEAPKSALVFCRTRLDVEQVNDTLVDQGHHAAALHGGMSQEERESVLRRFKAGQLSLLVATDVAARGLHVEDLSHVINYELPTSAEVYVHRIGRTGRAGKEGVALTLLTPKELRLLQNVERLTRQHIERATVPSPGQVKARHLADTRGKVEAALAEPADAAVAAVVEALTSSSAPLDVARAAVSALHALLHPAQEADAVEIPSGPSREKPGREGPPRKGERPQRGGKFGRDAGHAPREAGHAPREAGHALRDAGHAPRDAGRPSRDAGRPSRDAGRPSRDTGGPPRDTGRPSRDAGRPSRDTGRPARDAGRPSRDTGRPARDAGRPAREGAPKGRRTLVAPVRLYVSLGTNVGLRPGDLVGAIANEGGLEISDIGAIRIDERHSTVEVAREQADHVIDVLGKTTLRGRPVKVSKDRGQGPRGG